MEARPRIKLNLTQPDRALELISKILLVVMWALTIYSLLQLPATIPIHFNGSGQIDSYGNKVTLLILPVFATIIYFGLTHLNNYPHLFNYMTKITEDNAQQQYAWATRILRFLKCAILLIFSLIILLTYLAATGLINGLGAWFLPLTLGLLLIPTIIIISKSLKKSR